MREEAGQRVLLHRLHFAAQSGQRLAANLPQHLRIAPLAMKAAGAESSLKHAALVGQLAQRVFDHSGIEGKTVRRLRCRVNGPWVRA